jgi:hypothetical protein
MKLINYDRDYVYFTSFFKRPVVFPHLPTREMEQDLSEDRWLRRVMKYDLEMAAILRGLQSPSAIDRFVAANTSKYNSDYALYIHWDSIRRNLSSEETHERDRVRGHWEAKKGYYDRVPTRKNSAKN